MKIMTKEFTFVILTVLLGAVISSTVSSNGYTTGDGRQVLYILATGPYPDPDDGGFAGGISLIAGVRLALKQINNRSDILPGYRLEAIEDDSGCAIDSKASLSFIKNVYYSPNAEKIIGVIGPACSGSTLLLAPILANPSVSLVQVAPSATSPMIRESDQPTTFTMTFPFGIVESFVELMIRNNWTQVATLYDGNRDIFKRTNSKLAEKIDLNVNLTVVETSYVIDDKTDQFFPLHRITNSKARVIALLMRETTAQKVLCIAHSLNMLYPKYQWVINDKSKDMLTAPITPFSYNGTMYNCSKQMLAEVLNGTILNQYSLMRDDKTVLSVTNQTYREYREVFEREYWEHRNESQIQERINRVLNVTERNVEEFNYSRIWENTYYDATWALAFAFHNASKRGLDLSQYSYGQPNNTKILIEQLLNVDFQGATGHVQFTDFRDIDSTLVISQLWASEYSELSEVTAAYYSNTSLNFSTGNNYAFIKDTFNMVPVRIHLSLGIIVIIVTILIIIFTAFLQVSFVLWNDRKSVKATSPDISHVIFSGCYLFAIATILYTLQQILELKSKELQVFYSVLCNAITWCLLIGFSLIFGTVLVKVWRVYKLFRRFRNESAGFLLSDKALILAVMALVLVDCMICVSWSVSDPWLFRSIDTGSSSIHNGEPSITVSYECACNSSIYWIVAIAVYKGAIAILLVVFSILNRKIQRKHFSHTKKINILIYSLTVASGAGFPLYFLLININIYISFLILCAIMLFTIIMCCLMLFIPPLLPIFLSIERAVSGMTKGTKRSIYSVYPQSP